MTPAGPPPGGLVIGTVGAGTPVPSSGLAAATAVAPPVRLIAAPATSRHNDHREAGLPGKRDRHTERQSMVATHGDHNRPGRSALVGDR